MLKEVECEELAFPLAVDSMFVVRYCKLMI